MIYFSELRNKEVITEDNVVVGKLNDLIFIVSEKPLITKLVVRAKDGKSLIIPVSYLRKINSHLIIRKEYKTIDLDVNELHVIKNLLDKQIIDLKGNKIVRANDVAIQDKGELFIAGVDIGILGVLRWLGLEKLSYAIFSIIHFRIISSFLSWADIQPLELARGEVKLRKKEEKLQRVRPEDLADYLEKTNVTNIRKFLRILDEHQAAEVIQNLNLNYRAVLFKNYRPDEAAKILTFVDSNDAVDILLTLSPKRQQMILEQMPDNEKKALKHLLNFSHTPIGNLMSTEYLTVTPGDLANDVIVRIKKETSDFSYLNTIFVLNAQSQLIGVFSLHELLLQDANIPVYKFMAQNVVVIHVSTPAEIALKKMLKYRLSMLPVINDKQEIIGIVTLDDLSEYSLKRIT